LNIPLCCSSVPRIPASSSTHNGHLSIYLGAERKAIIFPHPARQKAGPAAEATPAGAISAQQLSLAYDSDKTAADQRYTGKNITVTGVFENGGKNPNGPGSGFSIYNGTDGHYHLIQCYGDQNELIAQLSMGDAIVVRGHIQSYDLYTVLMVNCEILDHTTPPSSAAAKLAMKTPADLIVSAHALLDGYYANGVNGGRGAKAVADEQYEGKTLQVSGTVDGSDGQGITITDGVHPDDQPDIPALVCHLAQFSGAEHLIRGSTVTVRGRYDEDGFPELKDCIIVAR
ncbi:MAG: OB-fold protein, partial [Candidatus Binataceae bacterium]